jgi:hypothetical protein
MTINKTGKITVGTLTILQLFSGLFFVIWLFAKWLPVLLSGNEEAIKAMVLGTLPIFLVVGVVAALVSLGLMIFYIIHAGTNPRISDTMKILWVILVFFFTGIAEVIYFFMEIAPDKSLTSKIEQN